MWYVIQVASGKELRTLRLSEKQIDNALFDECFIPHYEVKKKYHGTWHKRREILFPGYVFLVTDRIEQVAHELRALPMFTRLLGNSENFIPLSLQEIALISAFTSEKHRDIAMSEGIMEGDTIVVIKGALVDHSGLIQKVDRHKRIAYLSMEMFGRPMTVRVGLEIVAKRP